MINLNFPISYIVVPLFLFWAGITMGKWVPCSIRTVTVASYLWVGYYVESDLLPFIGYAFCYLFGDTLGLDTKAKRNEQRFWQQCHFDWLLLTVGAAGFVICRLLGFV